LLSKAAGAAGAQQDPAKKKQEEQMVNALFDHYKKTYFTSSQDFMRAFKKDPASILLDFSTLTGVGSAALPGKLGKIAKVASTVTDPIQSGLAVARGVGSIPAKVLRGFESTASNVPYNTLTDVYELARRGTPVQKTAFKDGRSFTEGQIVDEFADTITQVADDASAAYVANIAGLDKVKPDYNRVMQALQKEENALKDSRGNIPTVNQAAFNKIQDIRNRVLSYSSDLNHNLMFADRFKRNLNAERYDFPSTDPARGVTDRIKTEVRNAIASKDAKYANAMDQWQDWISQAKDIGSAIGQPNSGAANTMAKILKSMKSDLKRKNVIDVLAKKNERLPYLLAGYATNPMHRGNIGLMDALISGAGWYAFAHPLGAVGGLALSSPRLSSVSQTALGKIGKYGAAATSRPVTAGAYYGERALEEEGQQPSEENIAMYPDGSAPRNIRNNNPGNIIDSKFAKRQPGYAGSDDGFAVFNNPESGLAAHKTLLTSYANEGRNTIDSIIDKWSPAKAKGNTLEGTRNYKKFVADALGVKETDVLDMSNPEVLEAVSLAMAQFEGGVAPSISRMGRASGGSVKMNHVAEADKLIAAADRAKKMHNKSTEPLLNLPDEHVTHALAIANERI